MEVGAYWGGSQRKRILKKTRMVVEDTVGVEEDSGGDLRKKRSGVDEDNGGEGWVFRKTGLGEGESVCGGGGGGVE